MNSSCETCDVFHLWWLLFCNGVRCCDPIVSAEWRWSAQTWSKSNDVLHVTAHLIVLPTHTCCQNRTEIRMRS